MEIVSIIDHFHFLRPWWLLFIPLWVFITYRVSQTRQQQNGWSSLCDPALLSYLVGDSGQQQAKKTSKGWLTAIVMAGCIASIALAGPVWKQLPQPVFQATSAMVLILDLSRSMDAQDIKPSRLVRAKQKIQDILAARNEGQTGLIVFAGSAFDVVPLTTDNQAILSLLASLDTNMMPAQGSVASRALKRAAAMLQRGAVQAGSVVMLCDGLDNHAVAAAQELSKAGHSVSILAVGTTDGAPIPIHSQAASGFLKDSNGTIIIPRIDEQSLLAVTDAGHGVFQYIRIDDNDVMALPGLIPSQFSNSTAMQNDKSELVKTDQWLEEGPWLVLLLLPFCALAFRRGLLLLLLLVPLFSAVSFPSTSQAMTWNDLWHTPDQQAQALMQRNKADAAAKLFEDPAWKAAALYRAGHFDDAAQVLGNRDGTDNQYNKANALARAGKLQAALKSYDAALKSDANNQDARANRELVEKALKKQQHDKKKKDNKKNKQGDKQSPDKQGKPSDDPNKQQDNKKSDKKGKPSSQRPSKSTPSDDVSKPEPKQQANKDQTPASPADQQKTKQHEKQTAKSDAQKPDVQKGTKKEPKEAAPAQPRSEKQRAQQQLLRRIPDDPGGLLRRKFKYQYQNQQQQSGSQQAW